MAIRKVRVAQADGEIVFTDYGPAEPETVTHVVADHIVSPRSNADRDRLLRLDGARLATPKEAGESPSSADGGTPAGVDSGSKG